MFKRRTIFINTELLLCLFVVTAASTSDAARVRTWILHCWPYAVFQEAHLIKSPCGYADKCHCGVRTADCSSNGGSLRFVPSLPRTVQFLNFSNNGLTSIDSERFFLNVSSSDVRAVDLYNNGLNYIAPGAFRRLKNLTSILIGGNKLDYSALVPVFNVSTLKTLDIMCGGLGKMPTALFHQNPLPVLRNLHMSFNNIRYLDMNVLRPLVSLESLWVSDNTLSDLNSSHIPSLVSLALHKNSLGDFPITCDETGESFFPNLTELYLDLNNIDVIKDPVCLPRLQFLNMLGNRFQYFLTDTFSHTRFPAMTMLSVNIMAIKPRKVSRFAFNNSALRDLNLGVNHLDFSVSVDDEAFGGCPLIEKLFVQNNTFEFVSDEKLQRLLSPLPNLKVLYLGNTKKNRITRRTFSVETLKSLELLFLYGNSLTFLPDGAFDDLPQLKRLELSDNLITTVSSDVFGLRTQQQLQNLDLSGNPFLCSCDILWFRRWLLKNPALFGDFYHEGYRCDNVDNTTVHQFFLNEQACLLSETTANLITATILLIFVFLAVFTVFFGFRWHIRLLLYEACRTRNARNRAADRRQRQYRFDVFVAYAAGDLVWIQRELLPVLEGRWGLRLCLHQRDFVPGEHIVDNIADCVNDSDRLLMVFSSHFSRSQWCQFELKYCQGVAMERDDVMVLVALKEPGSFKVTGSMIAILRTTTYIRWAEEQDARASFWGRLAVALNDVIPQP